MQFQPLDLQIPQELGPYFAAQKLHIGDFSYGYLYMWNHALKPSYAIVENCLVLREIFAGTCYFHYPVSLTGDRAEEFAAIARIEADCRDSGEKLHFTNVPKSRLTDLLARYCEAEVSNNRRWRDYLYTSEDFRSYPGKKYQGQRNHVHKFETTYPDWRFFEVRPSDMGRVFEFLKEYEEFQRNKESMLADEEMKETFDLLSHFEEFGLFGGCLEVGGKICGFSAGERCGDMVIVHIEKALRSYEGVYPALARRFAIAFTKGEDFLNRMDDAGDLGLRKSKLQYHPFEIVDKFNVTPHKPIDLVPRLPIIRTDRLSLMSVDDHDMNRYAYLACDLKRNRYWGYDWMSDVKRRPSNSWFLKSAREDFKKRREMPLGIYFHGDLIGEVVLHRFGYTAEAEIGVRLLEPYEGYGFAREAVRGYTDFAFTRLNIERMEAKCYRENPRSAACLLGAGMHQVGADDTFLYFCRTPID